MSIRDNHSRIDKLEQGIVRGPFKKEINLSKPFFGRVIVRLLLTGTFTQKGFDRYCLKKITTIADKIFKESEKDISDDKNRRIVSCLDAFRDKVFSASNDKKLDLKSRKTMSLFLKKLLKEEMFDDMAAQFGADLVSEGRSEKAARFGAQLMKEGFNEAEARYGVESMRLEPDVRFMLRSERIMKPLIERLKKNHKSHEQVTREMEERRDKNPAFFMLELMEENFPLKMASFGVTLLEQGFNKDAARFGAELVQGGMSIELAKVGVESFKEDQSRFTGFHAVLIHEKFTEDAARFAAGLFEQGMSFKATRFGAELVKEEFGENAARFGAQLLEEGMGVKAARFGAQLVKENLDKDAAHFGSELVETGLGENAARFGAQLFQEGIGVKAARFGGELLKDDLDEDAARFGAQLFQEGIGVKAARFGGALLKEEFGENAARFGAKLLKEGIDVNAARFGAELVKENLNEDAARFGVRLFKQNMSIKAARFGAELIQENSDKKRANFGVELVKGGMSIESAKIAVDSLKDGSSEDVSFHDALVEEKFGENAANFGAHLFRDGSSVKEARFGATLREYSGEEMEIRNDVISYAAKVKNKIAEDLLKPEFSVSFKEGEGDFIAPSLREIGMSIGTMIVQFNGELVKKGGSSVDYAREIEKLIRAKCTSLGEDTRQELVRKILQLSQHSVLGILFTDSCFMRGLGNMSAKGICNQIEINISGEDEGVPEIEIIYNQGFVYTEGPTTVEMSLADKEMIAKIGDVKDESIQGYKDQGISIAKLRAAIVFSANKPSEITIREYPTIIRLS